MNETRAKVEFLGTSLMILLIAGGTYLWRMQLNWPINDQSVYSREKLAWGSEADVLLIGDSRAAQGFRTDVFEAAGLGREVRNFGFSALHYSETYLNNVEKLFDPRAQRRILICGIAPSNFNETTKANNSFIDALEFKPKYGHSLELKLNLWCESALPRSPSIRPLEAAYSLLGREPKYKLLMTPRSNGWLAADRTPRDIHAPYSPSMDKILFGAPKTDLLQVFFDRLKKWHSEGVEVYCLWPPSEQYFREAENSRTGWTESELKARATEAGVNWIHVEPGQYATYDGIHMTPEAAQSFSEDVAREILRISESQ